MLINYVSLTMHSAQETETQITKLGTKEGSEPLNERKNLTAYLYAYIIMWQ